MNKDYFCKQIDYILDDYHLILQKANYDDLSGNITIEEKTNLITKIKAVIVRITGIESEYYKEVERVLEKTTITLGIKLRNVIGILNALKSDLDNDYLKTISEIIHADIFGNYLDMAEHLLNEGYKNPAAVLVGSTLEANLKDLCIKNGIEIEAVNIKGKLVAKKADILNAELAKAKVYPSVFQKQITAWLGLRNSAAHGKYDEYAEGEVKLMIQGVRQFVLKYL